MDQEEILNGLIGILDKLSIQVRYNRGNFRGGLIRYKDQDYFYINRKADTETKISTILADFPLLKVPPEMIPGDLKEYIFKAEAEKKVNDQDSDSRETG